ncbi:MAG: DUF2254 family protein [Acidimicrobiia bacterium]
MESLRTLLDRLRGSLLLVPLVVVIASIALARLTIYVDRDPMRLADLPGVLTISPSGGRAIAAAVAGATITVAAIVLSITALSSQIAATQYSPRSVAGFVEDRVQKLVMGLVTGTFAFSLLVLAELGGAGNPDLNGHPSLSVTMTLVLGVASVIAIVGYLDHSLRRMRIDAVVRRIAEATVEGFRREHRREGGPLSEEAGVPSGDSHRVVAERTGWVRSIDAERLAARLPSEVSVRVEVRVGEAISPGDLLATIWSGPGAQHPVWERLIEGAVTVGRDRSVATDPGYGMRQLVDIGLRALSPGVNDPTTAVDVIQHLKLPLREILLLDAPPRVFRGPRQQRVFLPEAPSRSARVHSALSELRLAASRQPAVLRTMLEIISDLVGELEAADLEGRTAALIEEADLVVRVAQDSGLPDSDLDRILVAGKRLHLYEEPSRDETRHAPSRRADE